MTLDEIGENSNKKEQNDILLEKIRIKSIDIMFNILTLTPSKINYIKIFNN